MNVHIEFARARATPAQIMLFNGDRKEYTDAFARLMLFGGIETIHCERYDVGASSKIRASITQDAEAPKSVKDIGTVIKDAIAQILLTLNINHIDLNLTKSDRLGLRKEWENCALEADMANGGSGQDSDDSDDDDDDDDDDDEGDES